MKVTTKSGFTIIELLLVIVIIAILAVITVVSYTGIRQRAIVSSLQSDLSSNSTQLKLYQSANDSYPTLNDCSSGLNPAPPKICLKTSPGNSYVDYVIYNTTPQTFCIAEDNSGTTYKITSGASPTTGRCDTTTTNPTNLIATGGIGQIVLNWTAPSSDGGSTITGYKVYQGTSAGNETLLTTIGNVLTYTSTGLSTGTTYYYKITAINAIGESSYSNEANDVTIIVAPVAPVITVTLSGSNILATISPVTCTAGTVQYGIRSRTNDGTWGSYSAWSFTTTATQVASDGIKYGYQAQARCYSTVTTSATSTGIEGTYIKPISTIPTIPVVTANTVTTTTTWSWPASTDCPASTSASYQYDYTITPSSYDSGWTATASTSVSFTTSTGGQTYNVNVQAKCYSAYVSGGWSGSGSAGYYSPLSPIAPQVYTTPGTYNFTVPVGVTQVTFVITGAGGGGVGADGGSYSGGAGGGGGGYIDTIAVTPGQVIPVTVGTGGAAGGNTVGIVGGTGGSSSFSTYTASGGGGGHGGAGAGASSSAGGSGGSGGGAYGGYGIKGGNGAYGGDAIGGTGMGGAGYGNGGSGRYGSPWTGSAGSGGRVVVLSSNTAPANHSSQVYTTPGTYNFTVPAGITQVGFVITGAGGGGAYGDGGSYSGSAGGGGGGYIDIVTVTPGQVIPVTVGTGGSGGGTAYGAGGGAGTSSSFSSYIASGGGGGTGGAGAGASSKPGGSGGSGGGGYGGYGGTGGAGAYGGSAIGGVGTGGGGYGNGGYGVIYPSLIGGIGSNGRVVIIW